MLRKANETKRQIIEQLNKRLLKETTESQKFEDDGVGKVPLGEEGKSDNDKKEWKDKLRQRLWDALENTDDDRETEAAVKLSNEDVVEILQSMINSLDPIENNYDEDSGAWFGQNTPIHPIK